MTKEEMVALLKHAAQTETLIYSPHSTLATSCIVDEDYKILNTIFEEILPKIEDMQQRQIVWLRAHGICWKLISRELEISESKCKRFYRKGISRLMGNE